MKTMKKFKYIDKRMADKDYILYLAHTIKKLQDWKYEVFSYRSVSSNLKLKAPCNIDEFGIILEAVQRAKPELQEPKESLDVLFQKVEDYLKKLLNGDEK